MNRTHRSPTVALLPWGDVFDDFLDRLGVGVDDFLERFTGSWMFGYVEALRSAGVRTLVVCPTSSVRSVRRAEHRPSGARVVLLPTSRLSSALRRRALSECLAGRRDIASVAGAVSAQLAPYLATPPVAIARELRRERCAAILCQEYEAARFDVAVLLGRLLGIPAFATFQGGDRSATRLERRLRPLALRACAGLVVGSSVERARVSRMYAVPEERLAPIPNPIDVTVWRPLDRAAGRSAAGLPLGVPVAAWHGQMQVQRKGLDVLLAAWSRVIERYPDARLVLIGSGEGEEELRAIVAARGLPGVSIVGGWANDRSELAALLSAADVYAFPSRHEGFAVAPLEAMACGLPVVGADAPGVEDAVDACGIVVSRGDPDAFAAALLDLFGDERRRTTLGVAARERVEACFGTERVGAQLRTFLLDSRR
jgi:starch synthase